MKMQYSVLIQWSEEDQAYLVMLPEFGPQPQTHGATYKEAVKHAKEVMQTLIEFYEEQGRELPTPKKYTAKRAKKMVRRKHQVA
ncbi:MAG: type II toxin-antitoxin system HicB family antitoxin [Planctomycetes bacterium]|nr:type II toxin-antitoxin system HicB family antitoxin [Planctomycetota bacterium]